MPVFAQPGFVGIVSLAVAALLTLAVRETARRFGLVAKPNSERWHKKPTAMYGGVAIFITTIALYGIFVPKSFESLVIVAGSSFLFLVGLLDDILNIKPYQKLIGQMIGAAIVVGFGLELPLTGIELLDIAITVVWLIGITNALNLLDNMDGLAAGIAAIAAISLAFGFAANGQTNELLLVSVFIGALLGFLIFNFNPASIFMGDCGSMFVGFLLASSVLLNQVGGRSRGIFSILAVPVLILFVPIFDTTFVTVLRKLWGRKASQGGRDHTSHRLVALGLSERSAVLLLYALAVSAGLTSMMARTLETSQSLAIISVFIIILVIIGVYLAKVKVYEDRDSGENADNAVFAFLINVSHKRRLFEVFLDVVLISLAYYIAYVMLFGSFEHNGNWPLFLNTLPLLIVLKLFAFLAFGVYRGVWRYTSIGDIITYAKAVAAGSVLGVSSILLIYRFENFSRTVFVLDGIILLFFVVGSRMAFRLIRQILPMHSGNDGLRVLIYGAGDGGEMVLRELKNNPQWNYKPVGFLDDDPLKQGKVINGLKVYGANEELVEVCREMNVEEILISIRGLGREKMQELRALCRDESLELKQAELKIEPVIFE